MQSAGRAQFNALGDFLFIEESPGLVLITTQTGGYYELTQGAQIKGDRVSGLITVENKGEAGEIRIKTGFGEYVPPQRETVAVSAMPALEIAAGQSVNVGAMPALQIAAGQSVNVGAMPALQIAAGQSVAVAVSGSLNASVQVMPYTLPANPDRKSVKIKAAVDNAGLVTLAGVWPLAAGETIELETTAEIVLTGAATESAIILEN